MAKRKQTKASTRKTASKSAATPAKTTGISESPTMNDEMAQLKELVGEMWWIPLLRGIAITILGLLLLFSPAATVFSLIIILAVYWIVEGIVLIIMAAMGNSDAKWWVILLRSILGIAAGLIILNSPLITSVFTITFMIYMVAFMAIIGGIIDVAAGIHVRKGVSNEWSLIIGGVVSLLIGMLILSAPFMSVQVFVALLGILAIVGGTMLIFFAFQLRKLAK